MDNENSTSRNLFAVIFTLSFIFCILGAGLTSMALIALDENLFSFLVFTVVSGIIAYLSNYYVQNSR